MCDLRPYQKQALYWMSELEKGSDAEKETQTLHPCWAAYQICDGYCFLFLSLLFFIFNFNFFSLFLWRFGERLLIKYALGRRAPAIYVNMFSGEASTELQTAIHMARGGVCLSSASLYFYFILTSGMIMIVITSLSYWDDNTMW